MGDYQSFLICFHPGHTDFFRNGLPLGVVRNGVFEVHTHLMPNKERVPVDIPPDLKLLVERAVAMIPEEK